MEEAVKEGKYIYCIIEATVGKTFGSIGVGDRGDELHTICFNDIAAVVSNSPIIRYKVSRENTLAHEKAIEEVMKEHTVLPVRFATITEDEEKVKKILEKEYGKFKDLLNKIEHNSKENVKAVFDRYFNDEMTKLLNSNMKFYKRLVDNEKLKSRLKTSLLDLVYFEYKKNKKESKG